MDLTNATDINTTALFNLVQKECYGNYMSMMLGLLFLISEGLPFIKGETPNGIIQTFIGMINKYKK